MLLKKQLTSVEKGALSSFVGRPSAFWNKCDSQTLIWSIPHHIYAGFTPIVSDRDENIDEDV